MARQRSPNYPAHSLPQAIDFARSLFSRERRVVVPEDSAAKAIGHTSLNGTARVKISSLRKYGLVDDRKEGIQVSDLAMQILHPTSEAEKRDAIGAAGTRPTLFRELMPLSDASDDTITSTLMRRGFSPQGAQAAIQAFRETAAYLDHEGVAPDLDEAESQRTNTEPSGEVRRPTQPERNQPSDHRDSRADFRWPLPGNKAVEVRLIGGTLSRQDVELISRYLELVLLTVPVDVESPARDPRPTEAESARRPATESDRVLTEKG